MSRRRIVIIAIIVLILGGGAAVYAWASQRVDLSGVIGGGAVTDVEVPDGFRINVFAEGLDGPRFIAAGPDGHLYVADRGNDRIVYLPDENEDGAADSVQVFAEDLNRPHSLAFHEGAWYVGVPSGVVRLRDADGDGRAEQRTTLIDDYPRGGHSTRTVSFFPDGRMIVSIGSSCNVCEEEDPRRAAIVTYDNPAGQETATGEEIYAAGLRNAVGLAIHPQTGELWVSNNGRDLMGDDTPPETVYIVEKGVDYGWPTCHSGDIIDPDMGQPGDCQGAPEPLVEMQAHSAPLGVTFYTGESFPAEYQGDLFIAFHGSWNRSVPTGYKVVRLPLDGGSPAGPVSDFAAGWLQEDGSATGRPVGLAVGPDGALFISDDKGGFIYRVQYDGR
jgi:glucose/arabinose dehydrogenase